jgi:RecB family endonuclease NucS
MLNLRLKFDEVNSLVANMSKGMSQLSLYQNPSLNEAAKIFENAFPKNEVLIALGNCRVDYEGRASSTLDWGERIFITKADGSVLVHRPSGYEPVNWQPSKCLFRVELTKDGKLRVRAVRRQPKEVLDVYFDRIYLIVVSNLVDDGKFYLHVSEEQMRDAVLTQPSIIEYGFKPIEFEKKVKPGFIDVYGMDRNGNLVVVEIKRNPAGKEAVLQLKRYMEAVQSQTGSPVRGIVAGPSLRRGAQTLLAALNLEFKPLHPRECFKILKAHKTRKISDFL